MRVLDVCSKCHTPESFDFTARAVKYSMYLHRPSTSLDRVYRTVNVEEKPQKQFAAVKADGDSTDLYRCQLVRALQVPKCYQHARGLIELALLPVARRDQTSIKWTVGFSTTTMT